MTGHLEQGLEEVGEEVLEAEDAVVELVDVEEPGHLDEPAGVVGVDLGVRHGGGLARTHLVGDRPAGQLVPLIDGPATDGGVGAGAGEGGGAGAGAGGGGAGACGGEGNTCHR